MIRIWLLGMMLWCLALPTSAAPNDNPHLSQALSTLSRAQDNLLRADQAFQFTGWHDQHHLYIEADVAEGYHLYRDKLAFEAAGQTALTTPRLPEGERIQDPTFGDVDIYQGHVLITLPVDGAPLAQDVLDVTVRYQGCAEAGLCYPPEQRSVSLPFRADAPPQTAPTDAAQAPGRMSLLHLLTLFGMGIGLAFTPCVLPMLPVVSSLIVGQRANRRRAFGLATCYVVGMTLAYTLLGLCIGLLGHGVDIQAHLQSAWILIPMAVLCVFCALWLFDGLTLSLPQTFQRHVESLESRVRGYGPLGLTLAGALSTLILSPCLSAPLAGVLVYLSTTGDVWSAVLGLAALGAGMGLPLILCCGLGVGALPKAGEWMNTVKGLFGVMLIGVAVWLLSRLLPPSLTLALWGVLLIGTGRVLGVGTPWRSGLQASVKLAGCIAALWGCFCLAGAAGGGTLVTTPLSVFIAPPSSATTSNLPPVRTTANAQDIASAIRGSQQKPLLISLYADWCTSCHTLETQVFESSEVAPWLAQVERIRFDVTHVDPSIAAFLKQYQLLGPPSTLFFRHGEEIGTLRLQGDASRNEMIRRLKSALSS